MDVNTNILQAFRFLLQISQAQAIARRYFVTNGFDGALTMLALMIAFQLSGAVSVSTAIDAALATAVALTVSGLTSAYVSESAERHRSLRELEDAMVADLGDSAHAAATRWVPLVIAAVNGLAPLVISLLIIAPLWLDLMGIRWSVGPFVSATGVGFLVVFVLGAFLGQITGSSWLWSAVRTVLIAGFTAGIVVGVTQLR